MKKYREEIETFVENFSLVFQLAKRLKSALQSASKFFPISEEKLDELSEKDINIIDNLIYRFSKLQDLLGSKIFRSIVIIDNEEAESVRDVVNKMEKKYIVDDIDNWNNLRDIRNEVIHQYVPKGEKAAKTLNKIFKSTPELIEILCNIHKYAHEKIGIDMSQFDTKKLKIIKKKSTKKSKK